MILATKHFYAMLVASMVYGKTFEKLKYVINTIFLFYFHFLWSTKIHRMYGLLMNFLYNGRYHLKFKEDITDEMLNLLLEKMPYVAVLFCKLICTISHLHDVSLVSVLFLFHCLLSYVLLFLHINTRYSVCIEHETKV